jgi:hypothetical protein
MVCLEVMDFNVNQIHQLALLVREADHDKHLQTAAVVPQQARPVGSRFCRGLPAFDFVELACKRFVPKNRHHLRARIASRLAPTGAGASCI